MVPAKAPLKTVYLDVQDGNGAPAEQPTAPFDLPFPLKICAHDEAEPSKLGFLLCYHVVFIEKDGLDVQFWDMDVHPPVTGSDNC